MLQMFPIAVTCGNTFILKPSEKNPGYCHTPFLNVFLYCKPGTSYATRKFSERNDLGSPLEEATFFFLDRNLTQRTLFIEAIYFYLKLVRQIVVFDGGGRISILFE